ncbi:MAG: hypothetical protein VX899_03955 [Myxococcota bacterium]|nr:hypothetical protein [Myxococcota bacterium]
MMVPVIWLCTLSAALASEAPAPSPRQAARQADYDKNALHLQLNGGSVAVLDGRGRPLPPDTFARRADDWWTWQRIDYDARLSRSVVNSFYLVGGVSALVGANIVPLLASGYTNNDYAQIMRVTGVGLVVGGLVLVGGGYRIQTQATHRANDYTHWWTAEQLEQLVDQHNAALAQELGLPVSLVSAPTPPRGLELAPVLGPGQLGVVGRF